MRGKPERQLAMLTSLSTEDLIPADHPIRRIRTVVDEVPPRGRPLGHGADVALDHYIQLIRSEAERQIIAAVTSSPAAGGASP